jgi:hypothetical protein
MAGPRKGIGIQRGHQEATAELRRSRDPKGKGKPLSKYLNRGIDIAPKVKNGKSAAMKAKKKGIVSKVGKALS